MMKIQGTRNEQQKGVLWVGVKGRVTRSLVERVTGRGAPSQYNRAKGMDGHGFRSVWSPGQKLKKLPPGKSSFPYKERV